MNGRKNIWLSLIPCGFTILNLLVYAFQGIIDRIGVEGSIMIPWFVLSIIAMFVLWGWSGWKSGSIFHNYGKALITFNWLAFICLTFALVYYNVVPLSGYLDGAPLLPYHITDYAAGDIFAGLYSSPFFIGWLFPIYGGGNFVVWGVSINTLVGLIVFSIGYFISVFSNRPIKNM